MGRMTATLERPVRRVEAPDPESARPEALSVALGTAAVAGAGLISCIGLAVIAWFTGSTGSFGGAVRAGGLAWLVGNGGGLQVTGYQVTAIPLGALGLACLLVYGVGRWATGPGCSIRGVGLVTLVCSGTYTAVGLLVWAATRTASVSAVPWRVLVGCLLVGAVAGGCGALRGSGRWQDLLGPVPADARAALHGGAVGLGVMVVAGGVAVLTSLVAHFSTAGALAQGLRPGFLGGLVLTLVAIALIPNSVLCGGAYVAGAGFAVGTGTSVSTEHVRLGALPDFPLLAAVPQHPVSSAVVLALFLVPMVAGAAAAVTAARRLPSASLEGAALRGTVAGAVVGLGFGAVCQLSTGAVGPGRMAHVGPDVFAVLVVCTAGAALGGALAAIGYRLAVRRPRSAPVADAETDPVEPGRRVD
jgi:hypothetical protein